MRNEHRGPSAEEVMAYLDGELEAAAAEAVRVHLGECPACATVAADLREGSAALSQWTIAATPAFRPKAGRTAVARPWRRYVSVRNGALAAAAMLVVAVGVASWTAGTGSDHQSPTAFAYLGGAPADVPRTTSSRGVANAGGMAAAEPTQNVPETAAGPLLVRTARMMLSARDVDAARARLEQLVGEVGGFIGQIVVSGSPRDQRSVSATVRVPGARFAATLEALRGLGTVTSESQDAEDVTQQSVDLDARLANARASEIRLKAILEQRTGRLSDVLDVEREISRVRGEIERMEAERKTLDRRISYAAIEVTILQEHQASMDLGPQPLSTRFRNAFVDGWRDAVVGLVEVGLVLTNLLPVLMLFVVLGAPVALWIRRWRRRRPAPS